MTAGPPSEPTFDFGRNWQDFSDTGMSPERLAEAARSLTDLLGLESLSGKSFLDVGCGSGLFSLAALTLGAERVHGFDINPASIAASNANVERLREHLPQRRPTFEIGSALDDSFMSLLPEHDVVYAWGSLHHTGDMYTAIANTSRLVAPGGTLVLAIYNRHWTSPAWRVLKRIYNRLPKAGRTIMTALFAVPVALGAWATTKRFPLTRDRGMDFYNDLVDWLGGYPYEYASRNEIIRAVERLGLKGVACSPQQGWTGCAEFVFKRPTP